MIRLRHLIKDTTVYGLVSGARSLVGLLLVPIYTRVFTPGDYGWLDTLNTLIAFLTLGATLGMDTAAALFFYDNAGERDRSVMVTTAVLTRVVISSVVAMIISLVAAPIAETLFRNPAAATAVRLAVWSAPVSALVGFLIELLRLSRRPWLYSALAVSNLLVSVCLSIFFVVRLHWGVNGAFAAPLIANLVVLPIGFVITRQLLALGFSTRWLRSLLHVGLPLVPAALGGWLIAYANRYFLLHFGSAADVGLLSVGNKASAPLVLLTSAFQIAWGPFAFSLQKQENARQIYAKTLTYFITVASSGAVLVGVFAREALLVFTTSQYLAGHVVAGLMAFQLVADSCYYIVAIGLIVAKQTKALAYSVPAAAVASVLLNLLLTPRFSFFGAALASMLSYTISALLAYFLAQHAYRVPYEIPKVLAVIGLSVTAWALGSAIVPAPGCTMLLCQTPAIAGKLAVVIAYAAGLLICRIIGREELRLAAKSLSYLRGRLGG